MQTITINKNEKLSFYEKEAYETLRTNLRFSGEENRVLAITSCIPGEGKSTVSMNLAVSMAESGKKVVFLDADMHKSIIAGRYRIKNAPKGLSHYLSGQCGLEDVVCDTNVENLGMVLAGPVPPNPAELLNNQKFEKLIQILRETYEYVIIDCPPLGSVVDALVIGRKADGVLLVAAAGAVSYKFSQRIKKQLEKAECKILGVVLNKVDLGNTGYYKKYYLDYYTKEER